MEGSELTMICEKDWKGNIDILMGRLRYGPEI